MLMNYIDPQTDCIVVAGGDGTLMEVCRGQRSTICYVISTNIIIHFILCCIIVC